MAIQTHSKPGTPVAAIGARGTGVEIRRMRILRDVYYTAVGLTAHETDQVRLGPDEYYVLGDNSSQSLDCRFESFGKSISGRRDCGPSNLLAKTERYDPINPGQNVHRDR